MKTEVQQRIENLVTNCLGYNDDNGYRVPDTALSLQMKLCKMEGKEWVKVEELHSLLESLGFSWTNFLVIQPIGMHQSICSMKRKGYEVEIAPAFNMGLKPTYLKGRVSVYKRENK